MRYESPYYKEYTFCHKAGLSAPGYWVFRFLHLEPDLERGGAGKERNKKFNPTSWWDFWTPNGPAHVYEQSGDVFLRIPWAIGLEKRSG